MKSVTTISIIAVLAMGLAEPARANLVTNGGFETETPASCQIGAAGPCSLPPPGWTTNGGVVVDAVFPKTGTYDAALGNNLLGAPGTLSQILATIPGQQYVITFSVFDESNSPADSITVSLGGFTATITGDQVSSYITKSFTTHAGDVSTASTGLVFSARNGVSDFNVDDVSVNAVTTAIPEPGTTSLVGVSLASLLGIAGISSRRR